MPACLSGHAADTEQETNRLNSPTCPEGRVLGSHNVAAILAAEVSHRHKEASRCCEVSPPVLKKLKAGVWVVLRRSSNRNLVIALELP